MRVSGDIVTMVGLTNDEHLIHNLRVEKH